jgi:DNA-binding NarL/FixJ family response regulator
MRSATERSGTIESRTTAALHISETASLREIRNAAGLALGLTRFELQLVSDLLSGLEDGEIAGRASANETALARHVTRVFEKLGVHDHLELALLLIHRGFLTLP